MVRHLSFNCHAELVSAPISPHAPSLCWAKWTLKLVQGDNDADAEILE